MVFKTEVLTNLNAPARNFDSQTREQNMGNSTFTRTDDDAITVLTLSRPYCLDVDGKHALIEAVNSLVENMTLRVLIIAASHPQAWLVNVAELAEMSPAEARKFSQAGHKLADALASLPMPVIAAVDGGALGGGCELVLACDMAIAGTMARFGQIEAMGGVLPAFGGTWRLARRVGYQRPCKCYSPRKWWMPRPQGRSDWCLTLHRRVNSWIARGDSRYRSARSAANRLQP